MAKKIKFLCIAKDCPNKGIDYYWDDTTETLAYCGGCGEILEAQDA
jgi:hypothetical protein